MIPPFNAGVLGEGRGYPGLEFHDFGVDHLHTLVVGDAHAPVAVLDDVGVAYIVETHSPAAALRRDWRPYLYASTWLPRSPELAGKAHRTPCNAPHSRLSSPPARTSSRGGPCCKRRAPSDEA